MISFDITFWTIDLIIKNSRIIKIQEAEPIIMDFFFAFEDISLIIR